MKFNVTRVIPEGFRHHHAFDEVIESLGWSLSSLGHDCAITENWLSESGETNILFGAELLALWESIPLSTILFNLEQPSHPNMKHVRKLAERLTVWDYSLRNCEDWRQLGIPAIHVPIGYTPNLTRIPKSSTQDIDVCFFGWLTPRRVAILDELRKAGLNVYASASCYGGARDQIISRSKVCLNVHHDNRDRFEIVRVSYLMANSKCVVSEISADDDEYSYLKIARANYRALVDVCHCYVNAYHERELMESEMRRDIIQRDFTATVARVLDQTKDATPLSPRQETLVVYDKSGTGSHHATPQERVRYCYARAIREGDMRDYALFLRQHAHGNVLEIGVRDGASTSALLLGVEEHGGQLSSIDIVDYSKLFEGHPQWKFIHSPSAVANAGVVGGYDLILIDGDHSREGYKNDLSNAWYAAKSGGLICSHDISSSRTLESHGGDYPSIAVREEYFRFLDSHPGLRHEELPGDPGMGVIYKP